MKGFDYKMPLLKNLKLIKKITLISDRVIVVATSDVETRNPPKRSSAASTKSMFDIKES